MNILIANLWIVLLIFPLVLLAFTKWRNDALNYAAASLIGTTGSLASKNYIGDNKELFSIDPARGTYDRGQNVALAFDTMDRNGLFALVVSAGLASGITVILHFGVGLGTTSVHGYMIWLSVWVFGILYWVYCPSLEDLDHRENNGSEGSLTSVYIFLYCLFGMILPAAEISIDLLGKASAVSGTLSQSIGNAVNFFAITMISLPYFLLLMKLMEFRSHLQKFAFDDDQIGINSLARISHLLAWAGSIFVGLVGVQADVSGLSLFSGLAAAGLSVAMRESITNFFSGLQMSWDKTLKIGDVVSIPTSQSADTGSTYGVVRDIRSRYTIIEDRNTVRRLIPNHLLVSQHIEHWTHEDETVRLSLSIGIPYVKDPKLVRVAQSIMQSVCYDVPRVLTDKPPNALLVSYDESQLTFNLRFWIADAKNGIRPVISEVLISLYERLSDAGIQIPFPQQDVHIKELPFGKFAFLEHDNDRSNP